VISTKSEKSGAGLADVYVPRLFWFKKADEYLRGVSEAKNSILNLVSYNYSPISVSRREYPCHYLL